MGSVGVVLETPVFRQYLRLQQGVELFGGQELVPVPAVERLTMPVCQGDPGSM